MAGVAIDSQAQAEEDIVRATAAADQDMPPMVGQDIDQDLATACAQAPGPATFTPTPAGRVADALAVDGPVVDILAAHAPAVLVPAAAVAQAVPGNKQR